VSAVGVSELECASPRGGARGPSPGLFTLQAVSGVGLRLLVLLGLAAALLSRALAPALPGTAAGLDRWIGVSRALGAVTSAQFFVVGSMVLVWLAVASLAESRLPVAARVVALPLSFTVIVIAVAAVVSTIEPRWLLWLGASSGLVAVASAPRALSAGASRAAGLVVLVAGLSAFVEILARALALRSGERALAGWFWGAQAVATVSFVLELVALLLVALWVGGRRTWGAAVGAAVVAAVAVATTAAGIRGLGVDAHPVEVFLARALGELTRHPRPLVPLSMLHALEVARYALVLVAVLVPARAPTSAAALALALLAVGSTDVPACAVMLAIAALLAPLGAVHLAAAAGPLPHPSGAASATAPGAPEEPSPPVTPGGLPPARADAPESLEAARSPTAAPTTAPAPAVRPE